mmetsp:Transcript_60522/g.74169  ORF Transcript_60522/g.74169 Transcript_60522/m.74169 type:complete len:149 (-) Transcript_60522:717-1163(-)
MPKFPRGPYPKLPKGVVPLTRRAKTWPAVIKMMLRIRREKRTQHPRIWKCSQNTDIRQLWNKYYLKCSSKLYYDTMDTNEYDEFVQKYRIAKEFIDKVARERPTKIGYRADEYRDNMRKKLEYLRWKEIRNLCDKPPDFEPITQIYKM